VEHTGVGCVGKASTKTNMVTKKKVVFTIT
jgi:hypothetical protein